MMPNAVHYSGTQRSWCTDDDSCSFCIDNGGTYNAGNDTCNSGPGNCDSGPYRDINGEVLPPGGNEPGGNWYDFLGSTNWGELGEFACNIGGWFGYCNTGYGGQSPPSESETKKKKNLAAWAFIGVTVIVVVGLIIYLKRRGK
jgi:hypothetical protein